MALPSQITAAVTALTDTVDAEIVRLNARVAEEHAARVANHLGAQDARAKQAAAEAARAAAEASLATATARLTAADAAVVDLNARLTTCGQEKDTLAAQVAAHLVTIDQQRARIAELEAAQDDEHATFVLGETRPTALNAGCRIPYADLVHYPIRVTSTHPVTGQPLKRGDVISGVRVAGFKITVPGVTVRDCVVDGVGLNYTLPSPLPSNYYLALIDCRDSGTGGFTDDADMTRYEHVTVDPVTRSFLNNAFQGSNFTAYRCLVRGVTDAFVTHSSGSQQPRAVDILGCYLADFYIDAEPLTNQADGIVHGDGWQALGKLRRLRIEGNAVAGSGNTTVGSTARPRTSNVLLQTNVGTYTGEGVIIRRNWFAGHPSVGSTINVPVNLGCPFVLQDNVVDATSKTPSVLINATTRSASTTTIAGNVTSTGAPVQVNNS